jgi:excisionase family DNA binding protein
MSRAYRFSDFQAFLRNHSEASPARHSGHEDRLPLDRGSREGSPIERQSRDRTNVHGDNSDCFRTTYRHRNRQYLLRESEVKTLIEVGKFRVIPAEDLGRLGYRGNRSRMESDVQNLRRQGLIEQRGIEGHESYSKQVFTLTKEGHKLLSRQNLIPDRQAIHHGFVMEARHDADLYRLYHKVAKEIDRVGGKVSCVAQVEPMHRRFQFDTRENTASPRQHASRLAASPSFHKPRKVSLVESQEEENVSVLSEEYPLTVREAAEYLGVSPQSVYLWVERKQIPHLRVMGRNIRFLKSELETFRASFKQEMENG